MDEYKRKKYLEFLTNTAGDFEDGAVLNKKGLENLLNNLFAHHEIPFPSSELKRYFLHPNIIENLLIQVVNSKYLTRDDKFAMQDTFSQINKRLLKVKSSFSTNYRILEPNGRYPNIELARGGSKYTINNQYPVLITKSRNKKDIFADSSIINWLTRNELKFATCVMCAPQYGMMHF